jgi:hypothetical protein
MMENTGWRCLKNKIDFLGMVAYTCNSTYLEGGDWEDRGSKSVQAKSAKPPSQPMPERGGRAPVLPTM